MAPEGKEKLTSVRGAVRGLQRGCCFIVEETESQGCQITSSKAHSQKGEGPGSPSRSDSTVLALSNKHQGVDASRGKAE